MRRWRVPATATGGQSSGSFTSNRHHATLRAKVFDMAGVAGFEPANGGIKTRCLATWRRPNKPFIQLPAFRGVGPRPRPRQHSAHPGPRPQFGALIPLSPAWQKRRPHCRSFLPLGSADRAIPTLSEPQGNAATQHPVKILENCVSMTKN